MIVALPGPAQAGGQDGLPGAPTVSDVKRLPDGSLIQGNNPPAVAPVQQAIPQPAAERPINSPLPPPASHAVAAPPAAAISKPVKSDPQPAPTPAPTALACPATAITCVRVTSNNSKPGWLAVTFGQPFRPGDVPASARLVAGDGKGATLPLQIDERSTFPDGSLRFAVLSTEIPDVAPHEARILSVIKADPAAAEPKPKAGNDAPFDLSAELSTYQAQVSRIRFGDRHGLTAGIPFRAGEVISVRLEGASGAEKFSLTVTPEMAASGGYDTYMKIAKALVAAINAQGRIYHASWTDTDDNYEMAFVTSTNAASPFTVAIDYSGSAKVSSSPYLALEPRQTFTAALPPGATGKAWLEGPLVTERDITMPLLANGKPHPHLVIRAHLRHYLQSGTSRVDLVVENDWAYQPEPRNFTYDLAVKRNGSQALSITGLTHHHHARWHGEVWSEGFAAPDIIHSTAYLLESHAIPHYDPSLTVSSAVIDTDYQAVVQRGRSMPGTGTVSPYMPMTGGRPDIAILPRWAALYLLSMDPHERVVLFGNADAGAGIPIHYRDAKTDLPLRIDDHPMVVMVSGRPSPQDALPRVTAGTTPWTPQVAHHPSLFYVPYLLTGDLFYMEEVEFWAGWVLGSVDPAYRQNAKGLLAVAGNEVRGISWSLRTLGEAATILPDRAPLKSYFNEKLKNNLDWLNEHYTRNRNPEESPVIGVVPKPDDPQTMAPWQQDYLMMAVGQLNEMQVPGSGEFEAWLAKFSVGRWTSDDQGFCHQKAPAYYVKIMDGTKHYVTSLRDLFKLNWPELTTCPATITDGYPDTPIGYVANANAMLAYAADAGIPGAAGALARLRREAPVMVQHFGEDPSFDLLPRR